MIASKGLSIDRGNILAHKQFVLKFYRLVFLPFLIERRTLVVKNKLDVSTQERLQTIEKRFNIIFDHNIKNYDKIPYRNV